MVHIAWSGGTFFPRDHTGRQARLGPAVLVEVATLYWKATHLTGYKGQHGDKLCTIEMILSEWEWFWINLQTYDIYIYIERDTMLIYIYIIISKWRMTSWHYSRRALFSILSYQSLFTCYPQVCLASVTVWHAHSPTPFLQVSPTTQ